MATSPTHRGAAEHAATDWHELVTVILLSVTAIAAAWSGFQASKWGGEMSIAFSQASAARVEATSFQTIVNRKTTIQASLLTQWLHAYQAGDQQFADVLAARFPEPLATAFPAWLATDPLHNPDAPATPFDMSEYAIPEAEQETEAQARADAKSAEALRNNQHSDNYTLLAVVFAIVLFFGALAGRMHTTRAKWLLWGMGTTGFLIAAGLLIWFPKLV